MSNYGFGEEIEQGEQAPDGAVAPKFYRDWMDKISGQLGELKAENDRLRAEQAKAAVKDTLTAQGYAPGVADLYTGKPEGLHDWLSANGALFAKATNADGEQQGETPQGSPQTVVSAESQAQLANFASAGQGAAGAAASSEDQLIARLNAATSLQELEAIEREHGSRYV